MINNSKGDLSWIWLSCLDPLVLLIPKLKIIWLSNISVLSVPNEGYNRNLSVPNEGHNRNLSVPNEGYNRNLSVPK